MKAWQDFKSGIWEKEVNVRDFIQQNYEPFGGDESFLQGKTDRTKELFAEVSDLCKKEREQGGVLNMDTSTVSSINSHLAGYVDQEKEVITGLQTDEALKRPFHPFGGIKVAAKAAEAYGYEIDPEMIKIFTDYRKTHNQGVFDCYTEDMRKARKTGIITGLPDGYGRGRIIGDYRRVPLYGVDYLIAEKVKEKEAIRGTMTEEVIRDLEELSEQIRALGLLKELGLKYGYDISRPAEDSKEAVEWLYLAYLGAIKEQNGAAMSLGRSSSFLDIYFERDLKAGKYTESQIQELIDQFVLKLRMVRFARTEEYNELFSGDPNWITESLGGMGRDGRHLVTRTSYRILHTLYNLGPSPEPNITILWSPDLPETFKHFCAQVSIDTSSIQYENDDLMRPYYGDDYAISCCVSPMEVGKEMQFFGARANLAKALLYAINDGVDEKTNIRVFDGVGTLTGEYLAYDDVMKKFDYVLDKLAELYINTLNIIHYMHDKYAYERLQMALHDKVVRRNFATGLAGLSVAADSLSAIRYAKVKPLRNENGIAVDFETTGEFPAYGNNDDRVDEIAKEIVCLFSEKIKKQHIYRNARPTLSILTITSNVVYGKKTGSTPDGRKAGEPFAPGANPMHGRDRHGALASLLSVAKIPFDAANDGISNTFSIIPSALGNSGEGTISQEKVEDRAGNLVAVLDGYFGHHAHHLNVNVLNREMLIEAMKDKNRYPNLTIRVSGYAVNFNKLTHSQQQEVINRTFHDKL
jgi:formate C-acetyltransferase